MLDQGERTGEEIARLARATTANVYKDKSHYAKETGKKFTFAIDHTRCGLFAEPVKQQE